MSWHDIAYELIDLRSFSSLWYWIALAASWSLISHWGVGVPYDMVWRARRRGGQAEEDLENLVRINCTRIFFILRKSGIVVAGFSSAFFTTLLILGFWYRVEFAQAVFLLTFPLSFVAAITIKTAHDITTKGLTGEKMRQRLLRHRIYVQALGIVAIFLTAFWGMIVNMSIGPLGS
ncbi:MAG: component of SufBCD complex [Rhodobacteraceae bacterium]|nr:component of SufBCD complex [Paracoccaceae bacterium]